MPECNWLVKLEHVGKRYRMRFGGGRDRYVTLRETIQSRLGRVFRGSLPAPMLQEFWALRDVSLQVGRGESVGIVGGNGAGKSTLLRIISRITTPSVGRVRVGGQVSSLLEVGTGFHPELTARENIYLNGAILGMRKKEIHRKAGPILDFAGIEKFAQTPMKRLSSGMQVRLAFSIAAHLEPDILIFDEVLGVGDVGFQRQCLAKMREIVASGRSLIVVSHDLVLIEQLCSRAILLEAGRLCAEGTVPQVVFEHLKRLGGEGARAGSSGSEFTHSYPAETVVSAH